MKKLLIIIALGMSLLNAELVWQNDLNKATVIAKKNKQNIFVLVESNHCRWCKLLKKTTLNDPKIQTKLNKFILVKTMREDSAKYSLPPIIGVPTMFIMTPDRKIIEQGVGYLETEDLSDVIDKFNKKAKSRK
ncbi:protein disulfide-isomerase, thioredoxin [sediment metagenome]|uniref:Protein disulfide-isomerase, thioredoxin n=1 Tax=sediment metagenome TaxID=749907 RepID=D9PGJ1_9ZZZZ